MNALKRRLTDVTAGAPTLPLLVLFLLNMVDEIDQVTFGVVAPNIRDTFGVTEQTVTTLAALAGAVVIMLVVPVGVLADRRNRVKMSGVAALAWGSMTVLTGLSGFVGIIGLMVLARFGAGLGRVMNEPVHASLLADYYPPQTHGKVFSFHRMANPIGLMLVLPCSFLADAIGWRMAFVLLAVPTLVAFTLISRLEEPVRGASLNAAMALRADEQAEKIPFSEGWRRLKGIPTLKRTWVAAFFLGAAVIPITTFFAFFFEKVYGVESIRQRGMIITLFGIGTVIGLEYGSRRSTAALMEGRVPHLARYGGLTLVALGVTLLFMAVVPFMALSIVGVFLVGLAGAGFNSYNLPMVAAVAPPRLRSQAFGWFVFFFGLGAIFITPIVSGIGENEGYRYGIGILSVLVVISGLVYATAHRFVQRDAEQAFETLMTEANLRTERAAGRDVPLLQCRAVEVAYDQVQVLFGVDMEVRPGECVALLGTNGAGKSTLLKAISGVVDPIGGSVFFEGRDITHTDGVGTAKAGIVQVPGGKAVFPTLTVAEHLRVAGWLYRDDPEYLAKANADVLETFPRLRERIDQMAGNLSGGEQQMLALGMAFIAKPKLLMIDELSLGLAPTIVEQLLQIVRRIQSTGTAIVLVEQSINIALTVAERAYFLEKGEVRFEGPTSELLERDDIVRSVFLEGASSAQAKKSGKAAKAAKAAANPARPRPSAAELESRDTVLSVNGLVKRFGGIRAVDDTSFVLREGEILGLIGPNGAGKTTIFDLVSGFLTPDTGRITLAGQDITRMSPDKRAWLGLGRSFQDARLVPSLTVAENVAIGLERHIELRDHVAATLNLPGIVRIEEDVAWTVADLIELMNLGAFRDKFVRELSTGTRRIVDLAMCIAHDPKVLLLDEPSSGIAQRETEALGPLLERIQVETGCALLVIEHDMPLITSVSDRMIALELGTPIVDGTPDEVIANPRVVSSYLGGDISVINRSGASSGSNGKAAEENGNGAGTRNGRPKRTTPIRVREREKQLVKRLSAILIAIGLVLALWPSGASAADSATLDGVGWWWRAQAGSSVILPAPPTVPAGGFMVQGTPDGEGGAIAALRFTLPEDEANPKLTLHLADGGDGGALGAVLLACQTGSGWTPGAAQPWEAKPSAACEAGNAPGVLAEDGTTVTFDLGPLQFGDAIDVVLVPGINPALPAPLDKSVFTMVFEAPDGAALATSAGNAPLPTTPATPSPAGSASGSTFSGSASGSTFTPSSPAFTPPAPIAALPAADQGLTATAPAIQAQTTPAVPIAADDRGSRYRLVGLLVILLGIGAGVYAQREPVPALRALSRFGRASAEPALAVAATGVKPEDRVGGLGRFARVRDGAPPSLT